MNLTELQVQLRSIEEHISHLQAEIEKMKPQPEDEKRAMFENITKMARQFPLKNKQRAKIMESNAKTYIRCLAYLVLADENKMYEKLLYLCRLSHGMGLSVSSDYIVQMGMEIEKVDFERACLELRGLKYSFLTDALVLVNITEEATETLFCLVTDMARILDCNKEDLRAAAFVAKAVLTENFHVLKQLPAPSKNHWMGKFRQHIPDSWIELQRIKCGEIFPEKSSCVVNKRLASGTVVKKGEELILYEERRSRVLVAGGDYSKIDQKTLNAPCDGVVFFIESNRKGLKYRYYVSLGIIDDDVLSVNRKGEESKYMDQYLEVYVVSYFDDYTEFCNWHKSK